MKRKLLAILTSVLLLCAMLPLSAVNVSAEVTTGTTGDCTWTLDGTHLTISGNGAMEDYASYNHAPWQWADITAVTIEDGVTTIGNYAFFGCDYLTSVTIGDSVTKIKRAAFGYCASLASLSIPDNVQSIWREAFDNCTSLGSVVIGDGVIYIGTDAFWHCSSLTSITIGSSVTTIYEGAFGLTSLTEVHIKDLTAWFGIEFEDNSANPLWEAGRLYLNGNHVTDLVIPDEIATIKKYSFGYCDFASVTIPSSVTAIENLAFYNCAFLKDVYYDGTPADRANIKCDFSVAGLHNATWHYNPVNPNNGYSANVWHSVMDTASGNGLAFRFALNAQGVGVINHYEADLTNATVNYMGNEAKLVGMGAVLTNDVTVGATAFTLDDVNGNTVLDVPAVYLQEVNEDSCAFAARIINIPDDQLERTIYARPYYVVEVDGEEIVVYGDVDTASCAEYM